MSRCISRHGEYVSDIDQIIRTTIAEFMDERDSWSPEAVAYVLDKAIRAALEFAGEDLTGNSPVTVPSELLEEARARLIVITHPSGYDRDIIKRLVEALDSSQTQALEPRDTETGAKP